LNEYNKFLDTKKPYIDGMVRNYKRDGNLDASAIENKVITILDIMHGIFIDKDDLLKSQSAIPIYYLFIKEMKKQNKLHVITREKFIEFRRAVERNRVIAEEDITLAKFDLLEFDRMSQQGTNDAVSIRERVRILHDYIK
jgi:hypothetical protein